jgi:hypothetical protein
MQEYVLEGQLISEAQTHHDHASNPKEDDVSTGLEEISWEEGLEVRVLNIGPAEGREGEEP